MAPSNPLPPRVRAKNWLATWHMPTRGGLTDSSAFWQEWTSLARGLMTRGLLTAVCGQFESCPTTGRLHIQFFFVTNVRMEMTRAKQIWGCDSLHLERAVRPAEAWKYCLKERTRADYMRCNVLNPQLELGPSPEASSGQGRRTDLEEEVDAVMSGMNPLSSEFAQSFPKGVVQRASGLSRLYEQLHGQPRQQRPRVVILWGKSGTGKSYRAVNDIEPGVERYFKAPGKWWDGYRHQKVVVFNDFCPVAWEWSWNEWKRITDWCDVLYEVKGGSVRFNSPTIVVTANSNPATWWAMERSEPLEAEVWNNRCISCFECTSKDQEINYDEN